ncbi:MAG TPA: hydroxymethylpyrimidine/phosphomethylpyrimidine kinase [Gammaproteobacteria bacterium]|nr:hydroxymethylpyrimidine/phosphomethylpyrimidine kinase [Gammaproteobacteria bacterium]
MQRVSLPPVVLIIAGNDPSGGAGLAADIQAVTALGAHPAPVVAALTVQDTRDVSRVVALEPELVSEQAQRVLEDLPVAAVKLGLLASATVGHAVAELLRRHPRLPLVVDPVLRASGGGALVEDALLQVYLHELFPLATLITPNADEGRRLAPDAVDTVARAEALLKTGAAYVLMKGADEATPEVHNTLFGAGARQDFSWPRLPGAYHGSGCTLASAIAALLARGDALPAAVDKAQRYTWEALRDGWRLGKGQSIPNRGRR